MSHRHVHASGRFTASVANLYAALDVYAGEFNADVITLTETSPNKYDAALGRWAIRNRWHVWHPRVAGRDECAILARSRFDHKKAWRLSDLTLDAGRTAPIYLIAAQLHDGPWFGVWHTPAHNKGLSTAGKAALPTRVYRDSLTGLHAARMRMHGHGVVLAADWNLDLRRPAVLDQLTAHYPHMHFGIEGHQANTEGGRVIDGVLTNLPIVEASKTLPAQAGFDHKAVLTVLGSKLG